MRIDSGSIAGMRVTIMGLGLNGGGLASAQFFGRRGAVLTVTDLRDEKALAESISRLGSSPVRYVLGRHEESDFVNADVVIKNPGVPVTSPYLAAAREHGVAIETDLSVFLAIARNPIIGVTGSKGKSTTASAIAFGLSRIDPRSRLGGNITVSPLSFLDELAGDAPVVLELSSWQLGDLRGRGLLAPVVSAFTVILRDHMDKYSGMGDYIADKMVLFQGQTRNQKAVFNLDDPWQRPFPRQAASRTYYYSRQELPDGLAGGWLEPGCGMGMTVPGETPRQVLGSALIPGEHNRMNLLCAGLCLQLYGVKAEVIRKALSEFPGVEHRLEMFLESDGVRYYNDSAATIPDATAEGLRSLPEPVVLILGGTDKNLDFSPLRDVVKLPSAVVLLEGSATRKFLPLLEEQGVRYEGPFDTLDRAIDVAMGKARDAAGPSGSSVLFSPGCTSFGMFANEFDRGRKFKEAVKARAAR